MKRPSFALVLTGVLLASLAFGEWDPDFRLTTNGYPDYLIQVPVLYGAARRHIVADPSGRVHVVWWVDLGGQSPPPAYFFQVYYKRYEPGSGWTEDMMISTDLASERMCYVPAAAVDSLGNLHVVWVATTDRTPYTKQRIYYKMWTPAGGWQYTSTLISSSSSQKYTVDVACTPDNHVHVVWSDNGAGPVYYREKIGDEWQLEITRYGGDAKLGLFVAGQRNNDVHVTWSGGGQIWYAGRISGTWMASPENVSNAAGSQSYPSIACNARTNEPHILWKGMPAGGGSFNRIIHSRRTASGWLARDTVSEPGLGYDQLEPQLVFTPDGRGHAVWHGKSPDSPSGNQIRYSERDTVGGAWIKPENLQNASHDRCQVSINNGGSSSTPNDLHLVWEDRRDQVFGGELYYKRIRAPVGLAEQNPGIEPFRVNITPNPLTAGFALLRIQGIKDSRNQAANLRVFDAAGRCVLARQFDVRTSTFAVPLDVRKLSAGVYLVRLDADGYTATQKLVVQRKDAKGG